VHVNRASPDLWSRRKPAIRRLLATERPAILGVQEALFEQATFVSDSLGPTYRRIGRGRNADGKGEGCPVFFDSARLRLVQWRQLALSETPDEPGSRSWGNRIPRIVVTATFQDLATGATFRFFNSHFDHQSNRSRVQSSAMLASLVDASPLPAILTGDFNTSVGTLPYNQLLLDARLRDAWLASATRLTEAWGTFPNYRAPRLDRKRIDWILTTRDVAVTEVGINTARYGGVWASDHVPVSAVVRVPLTQ
jgi:endonuclease/exonuclease/phosphatase family metal-dependent hydrolase